MIPTEADGYTTELVEGQEDLPRGWVSYDYAIREPAPMLTYSKTAKVPTSIGFVLYPWKDQAPNIQVEQPQAGVIKVKSDDWTDWIIFSDEDSKTVGNIESDGKAIYLRINNDETVIHSFAADASYVKYNGQRVAESPARPKVDSITK